MTMDLSTFYTPIIARPPLMLTCTEWNYVALMQITQYMFYTVNVFNSSKI